MPLIENFGGNVSFRSARVYAPRNDAEVLDILRRHRGEPVRCIGSRHSWSRILCTQGVLLDLRYFERVDVVEPGPDARVRIGAGCTLRRVLRELGPQGLTLPTLGAILEQTIAGAIATGTHGSGSQSLSHFVEEVRVATFDPDTREPSIVRFRGRDELRAARCALGSLGVVLDVVMCAQPDYRIEERFEKAVSLDDVKRHWKQWPLQQFGLLPWRWRYLVLRRQRTDKPVVRWRALLLRLWTFISMDVVLHLLLKGVLCLARVAGDWLTRWFFRCVVPFLVIGHRRVDHSASILTLRHDLFPHVEMEIFIPEPELDNDVEGTLKEIIEVAAGTRNDVSNRLAAWRPQIRELFRIWTHHYPLGFRKILLDDTLVSMASPPLQPTTAWISISVFTYRKVDANFERFAATLAHCMIELHHARLHWGKYFPVSLDKARGWYPRFDEFRDICRKYDPKHQFWY